MVTLESTSDYWRVWHYVLESIGLAVQLVSASQARTSRGGRRPTADAMRLARLTQWGMLRPSFVPPARSGGCGTSPGPGPTWSERTRVLQRLEKLLEDAMIKITSWPGTG